MPLQFLQQARLRLGVGDGQKRVDKLSEEFAKEYAKQILSGGTLPLPKGGKLPTKLRKWLENNGDKPIDDGLFRFRRTEAGSP